MKTKNPKVAKAKPAPMTPEQKLLNRENEIESLSNELKEKAAVLGIITYCDIMTSGPADHPEDLKRNFQNLSDAIWHIGPQIVETAHKLYEVVHAELKEGT